MKTKGKRPLVIVDSPGKVNRIKAILGDGYLVRASAGNVRELAEGEVGVDVDDGFTERYEVLEDKVNFVKALVHAAKSAPMVYLATDPDSEGESIAWHISAILPPTFPVRRISFNQINASAVREALETPRHIDTALVDAERARTIIDHLIECQIGPQLAQLYGLDPDLPKLDGALITGRVPIAILRLLVERERERRNCTARTYWTIHASFTSMKHTGPPFDAWLARPATISNPLEKDDILSALHTAAVWWVERIETWEQEIPPPPPFATSTLHQAAAREFDYSPRQTDALARALYEAGLITYFHTDATHIAPEARASARSTIASLYGGEYLPPLPTGTGPLGAVPVPRTWAAASEAQESIHPTDPTLHPRYLEHQSRNLPGYAPVLYNLIWRRFIASQMAKARASISEAHIRAGQPADPLPYPFLARARCLTFDGFQAVYKETTAGDDSADAGEAEPVALPPLMSGETLDLVQFIPAEQPVQPPSRYSPARLIAQMEKIGIGRPSTYAPTLHQLFEEGYVMPEGQHLVPTPVGEAVLDLLVANFSQVFDIQFIASTEDMINQVARGEASRVDVLRSFWDGALRPALERVRAQLAGESAVPHICPLCGKATRVHSRWSGAVLGCSDHPVCGWTQAASPSKPQEGTAP